MSKKNKLSWPMGLTMANRYTSTEVMKATDLFGSILLSSLICQVGQFRFHFVKDYLQFFISANLIIYDKTNANSNIEKNNSVAVMKSVQAMELYERLIRNLSCPSGSRILPPGWSGFGERG